MTKSTIPKATSVSVVYDMAEDRLVCIAKTSAHEQLAVAVTRRLTTRLVNGFARLLERTSSTAQQAPSEVRSDIVMFEHQSALTVVQADVADPVPGPKASPQENLKSQPVQKPIMLMDAIDVTCMPGQFVLTLKCVGQSLVQMQMGRDDLHRFLALLRRKCDDADWQIVHEISWLDQDVGSMTLN